MRKFFGVLAAFFLIGSISATAADLSGSVEMHSRMISSISGNNYSENPTMTASLTLTKGLSFTGFFAADLTDKQSLANLQDFIIFGSKKIGKTVISGMLETVNYSALEGIYLYPSVNVIQPLGAGIEINFLYCYFIENINDYDMNNSSTSHIGLTKKFDDWSVLVRGHRSGSSTNFSSSISKEVHKNFSVTGFYHVTDVRGTPTHFGGVKVGYSF